MVDFAVERPKAQLREYPPETAVVGSFKEAEKALFEDGKLAAIIPDGLYLTAEDRKNFRRYSEENGLELRVHNSTKPPYLTPEKILLEITTQLDTPPEEGVLSFSKQHPISAAKFLKLTYEIACFTFKRGAEARNIFGYVAENWALGGGKIHDDNGKLITIASLFGPTTYIFGLDEVIENKRGQYKLKPGEEGCQVPEGSILILRGQPHVNPKFFSWAEDPTAPTENRLTAVCS